MSNSVIKIKIVEFRDTMLPYYYYHIVMKDGQYKFLRNECPTKIYFQTDPVVLLDNDIILLDFNCSISAVDQKSISQNHGKYFMLLLN